MCLYMGTNHIEIANEDIVCYKVVLDYKTMWYGPFHSVCHYKFNTPVRADKQKDFGYGYGFEKLCKLSSDGSGEICEGFHSYLHKHDAVSLVSKFKTGHFVKTCIIPKGTEYCMGEHDDIVSTHIIVFRDDKSYKRYEKFRRFMWFFYLIIGKLKK